MLRQSRSLLRTRTTFAPLTRLYSNPIDASTSTRYFDKILVANRGEIACRVMKTAKRLGIKTVAVYSEADENAKHVKMADEAVCVGPAQSAQSYLVMDNILNAIKQTGAQAVHPGYGFLSENCNFVERLEKEGVVFIGPGSHAIQAMGDKIESKKLAKAANVNVIPGFLGEIENEDHMIQIAHQIGYPVMIKASAGGGGKGMRVAWNDAEAKEGYRLSRLEAKSSFGDDRMLVEKFIDNPRHIEIQVLGDAHGNILYLPERECSIQRRNQKVIEEAPSMALDSETRKAMGMQAAALGRAVGYKSAGTVEMLVDSQRNFYFLEMNTRLQVEHPITEYITGIDLVEQMIRVAAGHPLEIKQEDIKINGWATECRVYAEDPFRNFLPSIGTLKTYREPDTSSGDVRVDSGIIEGSEISIFYDPMISKLVTHGNTRAESIERMRNALDTYIIRGVNHNVPFLRAVLENERYLKGDISTKFIPEEFPAGFEGFVLSEDKKLDLITSASIIEFLKAKRDVTVTGSRISADSISELTYYTTFDNEAVKVTVRETQHNGASAFVVDVEGKGTVHVTDARQSSQNLVFSAQMAKNGAQQHEQVYMQLISRKNSTYTLQYYGTQFQVVVRSEREQQLAKYIPVKPKVDSTKYVLSPMPGAIVSLSVAKGDKVIIGQELCVVEAMKMQNILRSERDGVVKEVHVKAGASVAVEEMLIEFE